MWGFMDWQSCWTTSEFTNPTVGWEFRTAQYKEFTKNCHVFMIEAKFYGWMPFLTPALFKISYYSQGYFFYHKCPQANQFLSSDSSS